MHMGWCTPSRIDWLIERTPSLTTASPGNCHIVLQRLSGISGNLVPLGQTESLTLIEALMKSRVTVLQHHSRTPFSRVTSLEAAVQYAEARWLFHKRPLQLSTQFSSSRLNSIGTLVGTQPFIQQHPHNVNIAFST